MQKLNLFSILLVVSLISLIILVLTMIYFLPSSSTYPDWWSDMWSHMGGMMVGTRQVSNPYLGYFGILFAIMVGIVIVSVGGLVYYIVLPEIKNANRIHKSATSLISSESSAFESVLKTLNDDEQKVLLILRKHDGKYLQKYIRIEAKLSRLKTHRVLARFAERGIVTLQKSGNTNEVTIAEWLI